MNADRFLVRVTGRTMVADDVMMLDLAPVEPVEFPSWEPGAHLDVVVAPGVERQYSLVATTAEGHWQVAILRDHSGRGGSVAAHEELSVGSTVSVGGPRNHFPFDRTRPAVFIAGGIGITAILPMIAAADADGLAWTLFYAGRTRTRMAFADALLQAHPGRVHLFVADEGGRLDVRGTLSGVAPDAIVYCCGPKRLIDDVQESAALLPTDHVAGVPAVDRVRVERFEASDAMTAPSEAFEVELAVTGITLEVPADRTLLEVAEDAGVFVLSSCREGTCGTCETPVLEGEVDHRDTVLSADEQAGNHTMMVCVSRAQRGCPRLVLDL